MIVVDASVLVFALLDDGRVGRTCRAQLRDSEVAASPSHVYAEAFSAVRGRFLGRNLTERRARESLTALSGLDLILVPTHGLFDRMWQLRDSLTGYDAAYVAAAELLRCPLVTTDAAFTAVTGARCEINLLGSR